jgi:hypothetical protein
MPHAWLAPDPRSMMPADDLDKLLCPASRAYPFFTMSINRRLSRRNLFHFDIGRRLSQLSGAVWWSQTGSNRRPPACKAGALPTELWPRLDLAATFPGLRPRERSGPPVKHWWAWKDLNFRPHAYQARALTN